MELAPIAVVEAPSDTALGGANDADTDADDFDGFSEFDPAGYDLRTDAAQGTNSPSVAAGSYATIIYLT